MLNLLFKYFQIRFKNLLRENKYDKYFLFIIISISLYFIKESYLPLLVLIFNAYYLSLKNDKELLLHYFTLNERLILYFSDFFLINLHIILILFLRQVPFGYVIFSLLLSIILFLIYLNVKSFHFFKYRFNFINSNFFEFKSFIRRKPYFLVLFIFNYFLITIDVFFFFLLSMMIMELFSQTYSTNESKELLIIFFSENTLQKKILKNTYISLFLFSPALLLIIVNHEQYYLSCLYIILCTLLYNVLIITKKYSEYSDYKVKNYISLPQFFLYFFLAFSVIGGVYQFYLNYKLALRKINSYV